MLIHIAGSAGIAIAAVVILFIFFGGILPRETGYLLFEAPPKIKVTVTGVVVSAAIAAGIVGYLGLS